MMSVREIFNNMEYGPAPESATIAEAWLANNKNKFDNFINAKFVKPSSNEYFEIFLNIEEQLLEYSKHIEYSNKTKNIVTYRIALLLLQTCPIIESYMVNLCINSNIVKKHLLYNWKYNWKL